MSRSTARPDADRLDGSSTTKYGLGVPNGGDFADPGLLMQLAVDAEQAGWDGIFLWDHMVRRPPWQPMVDPFVALTAMAVVTEHIVLGPMVTPLPRRRAHVVARQTVSLDHLSGGRLRLGIGLGAPDDEFTRFGEPADPVHRAEVLDESVALLRALWTGDVVEHRGPHLTADGVQFLPRPVNDTIPIWVGGTWPGGAPFRRAARHDGVWPFAPQGKHLTVPAFIECIDAVMEHRRAAGLDAPFDAVFVDRSDGPDDEQVLDRIEQLVAGGMTWWTESLDVATVTVDEHIARVQAGPPRR